MSVAERRRQDVESSLTSLSLNPRKTPKPSTTAVADNWEDDLSSSDNESTSTTSPSAPPPTPISPTSHTARSGSSPFDLPYSPTSTTYNPSALRGGPEPMSPLRGNFRPEKTTAVAGRMIAGALGVRTPKKTEEQRAYDKAVLEKERRRRDAERGERERREEEARKAREDIWGA